MDFQVFMAIFLEIPVFFGPPCRYKMFFFFGLTFCFGYRIPNHFSTLLSTYFGRERLAHESFETKYMIIYFRYALRMNY